MSPIIDQDKIMNATDCISAYDSKMYITLWNPSCEKRYGVSAENALGKHILQLFPHLENDYRLQCLQLAASLGQTFYFPNMSYLYTQPFSLYSQYIKPLKEGNKTVGVISLVRDHAEEQDYSPKDFKDFFIEQP